VTVNKKEVETIIDCGADVNYVNEEWCKRQRFQIKTQGFGDVKGFDGKRKKVPTRTVTVTFHSSYKENTNDNCSRYSQRRETM
jgi:hypothetical protein